MNVEQPIEKGQSYNIFRKDIDDSALVEQFGLDPKVAYTPAINAAVIKAQHRLTYNEYLKQGVPETKAMSLANASRAEANQRVSRDLKLRKSKE